MQKIIVCKGIPSCGKSTYCRELMNKEPGVWHRINNDSLREACDFGVYSSKNEETIRRMRDFLIKDYLTHGFNILHDNVNATKRNFDDIVNVVKTLNLDVQVIEKPFYVELDEAIARDSKRTGNACVGEAVIRKFWKQLGGKQFQFYKARVEVFTKRDVCLDRIVEPMVQDETLPRAVVCDLDGSICTITHRSPYDASRCLNDIPNMHVVELIRLFHKNDYKIIFCSGREDQYMDLTRQWLDTHVGVEYELFMRPSGDFRRDRVIKEEIFNANIKGKYYTRAIIDDRLQVCQLWFELGLPLFRVGDPQASF